MSFQVGDVEGKDSLFSFVQIGDTQGGNETQLQSIVDFILGNMSALNIEYVVHMGDIVEISDDRSDWELKNATFSQLTGVVSFGWLTGNHDGESEYYIGDEYFAFDVSSYPDMTSSYDQGRNTAQYFSFGSVEFLFVNVDYFANESTLVWFSDLYQQYPQATVIFSTHSYLDLTGNYTGDTLDSTYLDAFPRVKLVLCGHLPYALNQLVNGREEIRFDYQLIPGFVADLSDFIRVYTVFDDGTVDAWTYSQLRDQYLADSANQFSFNLFSPQPPPTTTPSPTLTPTPGSTLNPTSQPNPTQAQTTFTPSMPPTPSLSTSPAPAISEFPSWTIIGLLLVIIPLYLVFFRKKKA